jgi:hypothetical protein
MDGVYSQIIMPMLMHGTLLPSASLSVPAGNLLARATGILDCRFTHCILLGPPMISFKKWLENSASDYPYIVSKAMNIFI